MTKPQLVSVALGKNLHGEKINLVEPSHLPLLLVGPSLGTSVIPLWSDVARELEDSFTVIGWELPGHGRGTPVTERFSLEELADAVHELAQHLLNELGQTGQAYFYAGVSVGGATGLQLLLTHPEDIASAAIICSGAKIGEQQKWIERANLVEQAGTPTQIINSTKVWFAPGFLEKNSYAATELLHSLQETDHFSYGTICRALGEFDVRDRLHEIATPILTVAGAEDSSTPPESLSFIAHSVSNGRTEVLDGVAHLATAEAPEQVAKLLSSFFSADNAQANPEFDLVDQAMTREEVKAAGMVVRRAVLSDEHVDRASSKTTAFTADFQDLISRYAWGEIWTRPGLDRRMRSAITLTAMIAHGHWSEFEMHVKSAIRNGLSVEEIKEIILQSAIYLGVPAANDAFGRAQRVLSELGEI